MARSITGDFYQGFRFHIRSSENSKYKPFAVDGNVSAGRAGLDTFNGADAGFQSCTLPEISVDPVEYREGNSTITMKQAGILTISDMSLMRGVTKYDSQFYDWISQLRDGKEYRVDLTVFHMGRQDDLSKLTTETMRSYYCTECFPGRVKFAGDLDSTGSEVSIAECDIVMENAVLGVPGK